MSRRRLTRLSGSGQIVNGCGASNVTNNVLQNLAHALTHATSSKVSSAMHFATWITPFHSLMTEANALIKKCHMAAVKQMPNHARGVKLARVPVSDSLVFGTTCMLRMG